MNDRVRIVVDTNILGSAVLGGRVAGQFAQLLQATDRIDIMYDDQVFSEVQNLATVPYFQQRGITRTDIDQFLSLYQSIAIKVLVTSQVRVGRDRNDHFLLSLCRDAHALFLVTGDRDLLTLQTYGLTTILTLSAFIDGLPDTTPE